MLIIVSMAPSKKHAIRKMLDWIPQSYINAVAILFMLSFYQSLPCLLFMTSIIAANWIHYKRDMQSMNMISASNIAI